jgi:DivIVA domain-containing protein
MEWAIAILVIAVLGGAAAVAAGGVGEMSREPVRDTYRQDLPVRPLTGSDIQQLRFGIALRGYAMDQVDDVLGRLAQEIADRDRLIADLTGDELTAEQSGEQPAEERVTGDGAGANGPVTLR